MHLQYPILGGVGVTVVLLVVFLSQQMIVPSQEPNVAEKNIQQSETAISKQTVSKISQQKYEIQVTNGLKHIVSLDKIKSGGPPKDGIPSIDNPKFVNSQKATFVKDDDLVIGLDINGDVKAYPLFILVWHEIVNDEIGGIPVAVTYCPLCFTNQVFERTINETVTEFGTSGKLYNSNLVMYDRNTDSQWSQALGTAITGEMTGHTLNRVPFDVAKWSEWKSLYPDTLVLTTETGQIRPYGTDPYGDYYTDPRIIFPVENRDERLHPKEIILGFDSENVYKAYKLSDIGVQKIINDEFGDKKIVLISQYPDMVRAFNRVVDGNTLEFEYSKGKFIDTTTKSQWNFDGEAIDGQLLGKRLERETFSPGFWFEWVAFHPDTLLYGEKS